MVVALATAALLVPTGAAPFGTDTVNEDLSMAPAEGPNGDYAILNEDEEIELLLSDANPAVEGGGVDGNAVTPLSRVFTITYTGDESADIWLTDDSEDVRFYRGDDADDSLEGPENSVTLEPSESLAVGLLVDTRGDNDVESAETFTVHAEGPDSGEESPEDDETDDTDGPEDDDSDVGEEDDDGDDSEGGDVEDDSQVVTPTPGPPTETDTEPSTPDGPAEDDETPTPTETAEPEDGPPSDGGDGPIELGGIGLGPLLGIAAALAVLLSGLIAYRLYS